MAWADEFAACGGCTHENALSLKKPWLSAAVLYGFLRVQAPQAELSVSDDGIWPGAAEKQNYCNKINALKE